MSVQIKQVIAKAVYRVFKAISTILIRNGFEYSEATDLLKRAYVDVVQSDFAIQGKRVTQSRIAILTGLGRREVKRVCEQQSFFDKTSDNRLVNLIRGWCEDERFVGPEGDPRPLKMSDKASADFRQLVVHYGGDVPPAALRDELVRLSLVEKHGDLLHLVNPVLVPDSAKPEDFEAMADSVTDLISTCAHNFKSRESVRWYERRFYCDDLPIEAGEKVRTEIEVSADTLLSAVETALSVYDRRKNNLIGGTGKMRAGVGVYYFQKVERSK